MCVGAATLNGRVIQFANMQDFLLTLHTKIVGSPPGDTAQRFWRNIVPAFLGEGGVAIISVAVYVLAVRLLGPVEFGRWSVVASAAELLIVLPLWGLASAALVYLGKKEESMSNVIGTAVRTTAGFALIAFPLYFLVGPILASLAGIERILFLGATTYAFFLIWSHLSQSFFKGTEQFVLLAKFLLISAILFALVTLGTLYTSDTPSYESLLHGNIARVGILVLAGVIVFRRHLFSFSLQSFKTLASYGTLSMTSMLLGFFSLNGIDNLMINHYLGVEAVGVYAAYFIVFGLLVGKVLGTASQVFIPLISGLSDISSLFKKSIVLLLPASLVLFGGSFFLVWAAFFFYGERFEFDTGLALLVAGAATLYFLKSPFESILASRGVAGMKFGPLIAATLAFLNVAFNVLLIPIWGLYGAALGTGLSAAVTLLLILYLIRRHFA